MPERVSRAPQYAKAFGAAFNKSLQSARQDCRSSRPRPNNVESGTTDTNRSEIENEQSRRFERVGDMLLVSYSIGDDFAPEFTETYDIALGGMAMLTNAELLKDAPVSIQLELRGDATPVLRLRGVVRWSRFDSMLQRYRTGISFLELDEPTKRHVQRYIDTLNLLRDMGMI